MYSTSNSSKHNRPGFAAFLTTLALALFILAASVSASASGVAAPVGGPLSQATIAPQPVGTSQAPDAVATGVTGSDVAPSAVATIGANDSNSLARNTPAIRPNPVAPNDTTGNTGTTGTTGTTDKAASSNSGGGFPWLPLLLVLVLLALVGLAFIMIRSRRSAAVASTPVLGSASGSALTSATGTASTKPIVAPATPSSPSSLAATTATAVQSVGAVGAASVAAAAAMPASMPRTLTCPNCSATNEWSENFCHECGQDLKPLRASIIAAAAPPPDIVTDDMPYLETLDRTDDQLEYVLSRKRIVVGTAPGNDIVIDSAFQGRETVSPKHAELRKEGDGFVLVDLNSEHGTYVNGARTGENVLAEGDQIRFGDVKFIYRVP